MTAITGWRPRTFWPLGLALAGVIACSGVEARAAVVDVELTEWSVLPSMSSVAAGDVTFVTSNNGRVEHELVVLKTGLPADRLPMDPDFTRADERAAGVELGEIEDILPGETAAATYRLDPGSYVLFCNIEAHYQLGMRSPFVVGQP